MTTFLDGPAKGQTLMLKRCPVFLRVTEKDGKFDALDQLEDTPQPDEKLYAYVLVEHKGNAHMNFGRGHGGFYPMATFKLREPQPADEQMRGDREWEDWVYSQPEAVQAMKDHGIE